MPLSLELFSQCLFLGEKARLGHGRVQDAGLGVQSSTNANVKVVNLLIASRMAKVGPLAS